MPLSQGRPFSAPKILFTTSDQLHLREEQETLINQLIIKKEALVLGGDGRADSPGHSAKYGSYSIIEQIQMNFYRK